MILALAFSQPNRAALSDMQFPYRQKSPDIATTDMQLWIHTVKIYIVVGPLSRMYSGGATLDIQWWVHSGYTYRCIVGAAAAAAIAGVGAPSPHTCTKPDSPCAHWTVGTNVAISLPY